MNVSSSSTLFAFSSAKQRRHRVMKLAFSFALAGTQLLTASAASAQADFSAKIVGHITPHALCPDGVQICGVATIAGFVAPAEYRWTVISVAPPSGSCGNLTEWVDYGATSTFTLSDGSKLTLGEIGTACYPGKSFPTGGISYGNPRTLSANWTVQSARGEFSGITGTGTTTGRTVGGVFHVTYDSKK